MVPPKANKVDRCTLEGAKEIIVTASLKTKNAAVNGGNKVFHKNTQQYLLSFCQQKKIIVAFSSQIENSRRYRSLSAFVLKDAL